jgi:hypothetical protein
LAGGGSHHHPLVSQLDIMRDIHYDDAASIVNNSRSDDAVIAATDAEDEDNNNNNNNNNNDNDAANANANEGE